MSIGDWDGLFMVASVIEDEGLAIEAFEAQWLLLRIGQTQNKPKALRVVRVGGHGMRPTGQLPALASGPGDVVVLQTGQRQIAQARCRPRRFSLRGGVPLHPHDLQTDPAGAGRPEEQTSPITLRRDHRRPPGLMRLTDQRCRWSQIEHQTLPPGL